MKKENICERMVYSGVRLTESEKRTLKLASVRTHMTQSSFMRYVIFDAIERFEKRGEI